MGWGQEPCLRRVSLGGLLSPAAFWSETQEDTGLKATRGPAELTWRGLVEPAASEEGLQPEGAWDRALQVLWKCGGHGWSSVGGEG